MRLVACAAVVAMLSTSTVWAEPPGETPPTVAVPGDTAAPRPGSPELDSGTITGQFLLSGVFGLGGALAAGFLSYSLLCANDDCGNDDGAIAGVLIAGYAGGSLGIAGGTYLVGNDATAEGSFGAAFGGALLGGVAGIGAAAIVDKTLGYDHDDARALLETSAVLGGWIGGSLVGYYLTRHWKTPALDNVRPMLRADSRGMSFGFGAAF
jgi:hypothetical protein